MAWFTRAQSTAFAALLLGLSVFLSRILGLVRDKIISYYFGSGYETDVYFVAFVIPDFISYLLAGGYFSITLVPLLIAAFKEDEDDAWKFFSTALCWASISISVLILLMWCLAPYLVPYIAPGFSQEKLTLLVYYLRIILPAQAFFLPGACFTALLYCRKQFLVPSLTPLVYNLCIIGGGLFCLFLFPQYGMEGFCWGVLAGAFLGNFLLPCCAVHAGGLKFSIRFVHTKMYRLLVLALPLMLGLSVSGLDEQLIRIFGSLGEEGSVSLLNYTRRIMMVPVGVIAQAAGLASYPFLAMLVTENKTEQFMSCLNKTLTNSLLLAIPVAFWMALFAQDIMSLIFQQGQFTAEDTSNSSSLLVVMLLSVIFWPIQQIVSRGFYAYQDTLSPAVIGTLSTIFACGIYYFGAMKFGTFGVASASTFAICLYTALLCLYWVKKHGKEALRQLFSSLYVPMALSAPALTCSWGVAFFVRKYIDLGVFWNSFFVLLASGICFMGVFFLLGKLFAPKCVEPFLFFLRRQKKKSA